MPSLTLGWEYLTGYAVATDPSSRERAEWPPHPARLFMALAAAWFETEPPAIENAAYRAWEAEGAALRWLETLGDPELHLPPFDAVFSRSNVTVYVPVNDRAGPAAATLQSAPAITRSKQPRTFPRVWVGHEPCYMSWPEAKGIGLHDEALERLCAKVTRIGHSSSLVRVWVAESGEPAIDHPGERWVANDGLADQQIRRVSEGTLHLLTERYNEPTRARHAELTGRIAALTVQKKTMKGKGAKERKAAIDTEIASLQEQAGQLNPRPPLRPSLGMWSGYRRGLPAAPADVHHTLFDADILVLVHDAGPRLPLVSTLVVTRALRGTVMAGSNPPPAWVSGHEPSGEPLRSDDDGHLALVPLPFVGREHADGHLLGVGLVFPRSVDRRERGRVLGKLLVDATGQSRPVDLKLGRLGVWTVLKRDWSETRFTLARESWTAHPRGADTWASVTPVVLDRFPKSDRLREREAWTEEVVDIVVAACVRIGLPEPAAVDIDTTSWHLGSPRAASKRRILRGHTGMNVADAAFGDGFPEYPCKGTSAPRPQIHVWLRFSEPVLGPVLLGAGRYQGYGLCKPWKEVGR